MLWRTPPSTSFSHQPYALGTLGTLGTNGGDDTPIEQVSQQAERCSAAHLEPLSWGGARKICAQDLHGGLSHVKACRSPSAFYGVTHPLA